MEEHDYFTAPFGVDYSVPSIVTRKTHYSEELKKFLMESPERMYSHSLSTCEKLPDELHEAMLVWSFDSKKSEVVRMYLEWVDRMEYHRLSLKKFEDAHRAQERLLLVLMALTSFGLASTVLFSWLNS
jgi:hypothetical protein